jgi:hypothetical protein
MVPQGKMTKLETLLDQIMMAGEGSVQLTSHSVKKEAGTWKVEQTNATVFLPKVKA